jgi:hypothetical protein
MLALVNVERSVSIPMLASALCRIRKAGIKSSMPLNSTKLLPNNNLGTEYPVMPQATYYRNTVNTGMNGLAVRGINGSMCIILARMDAIMGILMKRCSNTKIPLLLMRRERGQIRGKHILVSVPHEQ